MFSSPHFPISRSLDLLTSLCVHLFICSFLNLLIA
jgi:hypothetical protein